MKLLEVQSLYKSFATAQYTVHALSDVSFRLEAGQSLGVVGESGSGKSTLAKILTLLQRPDAGKIFLNGQEITHVRGKQARQVYRQVQLVFQNAAASFDPRKTIGASINEVLHNYRLAGSARTLLERTGLTDAHLNRYCHQLSGGQCQRAAIARALAVSPKLLICDEITSALDVSVQAQIIQLLLQLKSSEQLSYLLICHNLAVIQLLCEQTLVLYAGHIVEYGDTNDILHTPAHPYTRLLVRSAFADGLPDATAGETLPGTGGCCFSGRCRNCSSQCLNQTPVLRPVGDGHFAACWHMGKAVEP